MVSLVSARRCSVNSTENHESDICANSFGFSRLPYLLGEKHSKMALRTVCGAALRTGTDLGVNNARTFVSTGIVTTLHTSIVFTFRYACPCFMQHCVHMTGVTTVTKLSSSAEKDDSLNYIRST